MDPGSNRRPVWNPSPSGASHNQYIQSAAAESSTSVSDSTSRQFPALAAAANPYPNNAFQQRSLQEASAVQSHYQGIFGMSGAHSQSFQPAQSSYSQSSAGDYRDLPSGSDEASSYPILRINEDVRIHGQPVGSSTGSQSVRIKIHELSVMKCFQSILHCSFHRMVSLNEKDEHVSSRHSIWYIPHGKTPLSILSNAGLGTVF